MERISQSLHRQAVGDSLVEDIRRKAVEESLTFQNAAVRVVLDWLGYELDSDLTFISMRQV